MGRRASGHDGSDSVSVLVILRLVGQFGMLRAELGHRLDELSDRITTSEGGDLWRVGAGPAEDLAAMVARDV